MAKERLAARSVPILSKYVQHLEGKNRELSQQVEDLSGVSPGGSLGHAQSSEASTGLFDGVMGDGKDYSGGLFKSR